MTDIPIAGIVNLSGRGTFVVSVARRLGSGNSFARLLCYPAQAERGRRKALWVRVGRQHSVKIGTPGPQLRQRLDPARILETGRARTQHLAHRVARHLQLANDLLDRLDKVLAPDPPIRLHNSIPLPPTRVPQRVAFATHNKGGQSSKPITPLLG